MGGVGWGGTVGGVGQGGTVGWSEVGLSSSTAVPDKWLLLKAGLLSTEWSGIFQNGSCPLLLPEHRSVSSDPHCEDLLWHLEIKKKSQDSQGASPVSPQVCAHWASAR